MFNKVVNTEQNFYTLPLNMVFQNILFTKVHKFCTVNLGRNECISLFNIPLFCSEPVQKTVFHYNLLLLFRLFPLSRLLFSNQGAYVKYVGGRAGGFYKFFKKNFIAQETIDLNILQPSNFFGKYFMAPPINFGFLFNAYLQQCFRVTFKFQSTKEVNIHNRIQKTIFK